MQYIGVLFRELQCHVVQHRGVWCSTVWCNTVCCTGHDVHTKSTALKHKPKGWNNMSWCLSSSCPHTLPPHLPPGQQTYDYKNSPSLLWLQTFTQQHTKDFRYTTRSSDYYRQYFTNKTPDLNSTVEWSACKGCSSPPIGGPAWLMQGYYWPHAYSPFHLFLTKVHKTIYIWPYLNPLAIKIHVHMSIWEKHDFCFGAPAAMSKCL